MNEPILRAGSQGDWVFYLQQLLGQAGYDPGGVDGDFGAGTLSALRAFQRDYGLTDDGVAGPATWSTLTGETTPADGGTTPADGGTTPTGNGTTPTDGGTDVVPDSLVTAGAPASLSEWSDAEKEAFFDGTVSQSNDAGVPEDVPLLAMSDVPSDGGVIA
jgi:peptidoglycan hydrolase-like protein with peptidoglycan-binding domain